MYEQIIDQMQRQLIMLAQAVVDKDPTAEALAITVLSFYASTPSSEAKEAADVQRMGVCDRNGAQDAQ
jgi:hypothetical protein